MARDVSAVIASAVTGDSAALGPVIDQSAKTLKVRLEEEVEAKEGARGEQNKGGGA